MVWLLIPFLLFAANIKVNSTKIVAGDEVVFTITADGKSVKFPAIDKIENYPVTQIGATSNILMINGDIKESISKTYMFMPDKNVTIPSFTIIVDGKATKTKPIKIIVTPPTKTKGNYTLDESISKSALYLGESAILTLKFKYKKPFETLNLYPPKLNDFFTKLISKKEKDGLITYKFLIIPQKSGNYSLISKADVGILKKRKIDDPLFNLVVSDIVYKRVFSNSIKLKVLPIPNDSIYGDFNISIFANKEVLANRPNRVTLKIQGCGDFVDMKEFDLKIPNTTIFKEKPKISTKIIKDNLCGTYTQTFNILATSDYVIPSISLKTFNGKLKIISTKPIDVKVIGKTASLPPEKNNNHLYLIIAILVGVLIGLIAAIIFFKLKNSLYFKIKTANEKELFNLLIEYKDDEFIKDVLTKLEENIYNKANHKIDRKKIIKHLSTKSSLNKDH